MNQIHITALGQSLQEKNGPIKLPDLIGPTESDPKAAYIHVPFCFHKCHYCDFYSFVDSRDRRPQFTQRLCNDIQTHLEWVRSPLEAIFVGGGTPTLLDPEHWESILKSIRDHWQTAADLEFTVEANPETVTSELVDILAGGGVNRFSIGAQSFHPHLLKTLERHHDPESVRNAVAIARGSGIHRLNLDLIFAIPGQTLEEWKADLDAVLELEPSHVSAYSLMYEPNTALTQRLRAGDVERVDETLEAEMYEHAMERLAAAGYEHYEISNWCRPDEACRHNMIYWQNESWLALGPSASGHLGGLRWKNLPRLADYLDHEPWMPVTDAERVDEDGTIGERLMLGLRLIGGIDASTMRELLSRGERAEARRAAIDDAVQRGLMVTDAQSTRLTPAGLLLADEVIAPLI